MIIVKAHQDLEESLILMLRSHFQGDTDEIENFQDISMVFTLKLEFIIFGILITFFLINFVLSLKHNQIETLVYSSNIFSSLICHIIVSHYT